MKKLFATATVAIVLSISVSAFTPMTAFALDLLEWGTSEAPYELHDNDVLNLTYIDENAQKLIKVDANADVTIVGDPRKTYTDLNIECGENAKLTINNLNIVSNDDVDKDSLGYESAISFTKGNNNQLIVEGKNNISVPLSPDLINGFGAAIGVEEGVTVTIKGKTTASEKGYLKTTGNNGGAGIGGGYGQSAGNIILEDVKVEAIGAGAGIGGGIDKTNGELETANGGSVDSILIKNSDVTATGNGGAGIGGGSSNATNNNGYKSFGGDIGTIEIINSNINSTGKAGAGIGGGAGISDGYKRSQAIGGGAKNDAPENGVITINNTSVYKVTAVGEMGAGIGGGEGYGKGLQGVASGGAMNNINIINGHVNAEGKGGAGIGGGNGHAIGGIVNRAIVSEGTPLVGDDSSAVGGNAGNITISGGNVISKTSEYGAGIGGGGGYSEGVNTVHAVGGTGGSIKISNGTIDSFANANNRSGAAIGGGAAVIKNSETTTNTTAAGGYGGEILISGGTVKANTVLSANSSVTITEAGDGKIGNSASIGGGGVVCPYPTAKCVAGSGGEIIIVGNSNVTPSNNPNSIGIGGGTALVPEPNGTYKKSVNDTLTKVLVVSNGDNPLAKSNNLLTKSVTLKTGGAVNETAKYSIKNPFPNSTLGSELALGKPGTGGKFNVSYYGITPPSLTFTTPGYAPVTADLTVKSDIVVDFKK